MSVWECAAYCTCLIAVWVALFGLTGSVSCGGGLTDDHQIVEMDAQLRDSGWLGVTRTYVAAESNLRFRPAYIATRVLKTQLMGTRFDLWTIYNVVLLILTSTLLWFALRNVGWAAMLAFCCVLLVFLGPQIEAYYRLGPNEPHGMLLLVLAMVAAARLPETSRPWPWRSVFLVSGIGMTFYKESFILVVPALWCWLVWCRHRRGGTTLMEAVRHCLVELFVLGAVASFEIVYVQVMMGGNQHGYAAPASRLKGMLKAMAGLLERSEVILGFAVAGMVFLAFWERTRSLFRAVGLMAYTVFGLSIAGSLVVVPQAFVYSAYGLEGRYLLPGWLGVVFVLGALVHWASQKAPYLRPALIVVLLVLVGANFGTAYDLSRRYSRNCVLTTQFMEAIREGTDRKDVILLAGDPARHFEWLLSLGIYLRDRYDRPSVYLQKLPAPPYTEFEQFLADHEDFERRFARHQWSDIEDPRGIAAIAIYGGSEDRFLERNADWFDPTQWKRQSWFLRGHSQGELTVVFTRRSQKAGQQQGSPGMSEGKAP